MRGKYAMERLSNAERQRQYRARRKNRVDQSADIERQARLLVMQLRTDGATKIVLELPPGETPAEKYLSQCKIRRYDIETMVKHKGLLDASVRTEITKRNVTAAAKSPPPTRKRKAK